MSDKKHIDRLFQEKFKDFDATPSAKVWEGIEARLQEKKKKRRIIPIWWKVGGVAAALLLMFTVGNAVFNKNVEPPTIVDVDKTETKNSENINTSNEIIGKEKEDSAIASEDSDAFNSNEETATDAKAKNDSKLKPFFNSNGTKNKNALASQNSTSNTNSTSTADKANDLVNKNSVSKNDNKKAFAQQNNLNSENNAQNQNIIKNKEDIQSLINENGTLNAVARNENSELKENKTSETEEYKKEDQKGQDIEDAIAEANTNNEKEKEKEIRRWSIAPNVAPVYFNSLGQGSSIDAQFNNNNTSSDISMSYGVKGRYAVNDRLKITVGVNRVNFSNTTNDIIALSDTSFSATAAVTNNLQNVQLRNNVNENSLVLISKPNINATSVSQAVNTAQTGDLSQNFGFIEIPVELEYRVIDKKVGLNITGGFSTLLLNENDIYADVNGENTLIGEANNLNSTSYSANFGVGLDYSLTEKININLEPKFKYQLNTFNNTTGDFRPFFIGVYTGLSFKF